MKRLLFLSALVILTQGYKANAQDEKIVPEKNTNQKHSLGLGAGFTTGIGLTYRYMPNKIGFQLMAGGFKINDETLGSGGLTLLCNLSSTEKINLFTYYSNSIWYRTYQQYVYSSYGSYEEVHKTSWNTGLGLGLEIIAGQKVGFNFMAGWAGYESFRLILPTAETSILIKF